MNKKKDLTEKQELCVNNDKSPEYAVQFFSRGSLVIMTFTVCVLARGARVCQHAYRVGKTLPFDLKRWHRQNSLENSRHKKQRLDLSCKNISFFLSGKEKK